MKQQNSLTKEKFKDFDGTFKICTFSLAFAFLYPNNHNKLKRAIMVTLVVAVNGAELFWFVAYTIKCLYTKDIYNLSRNMTLFVLAVLFFTKNYQIIYITKKFARLLDIISEDFLNANNLGEDYQQIYKEHIKQGKIAEIFWLLAPILMSGIFPMYAGILMSIESIQTDDFVRRMVHEQELKLLEHIQYESPVFHCIFAYNCFQCISLIPNYCGFDSSFCICTIHLSLKLKLMIHKAQRAFAEAKDCTELRKKVHDVIKDHQNALDFYMRIEDVYGPWLISVFLLSSFMISFNLYQIYLLKRMEPKATMFLLFGVLHIYSPCYYASTLTAVGEDISDELYLVPWERWADPVTNRLLVGMIQRAQKRLIVTGCGIVIFNMEIFKSIMQTSYSFMTLITSGSE